MTENKLKEKTPIIKTLKNAKNYREDLFGAIAGTRKSLIKDGSSNKIKGKILKDLNKSYKKNTLNDQEYQEAKNIHWTEGRKEKHNSLFDKLTDLVEKYNELIDKINEMNFFKKKIVKEFGGSIDVSVLDNVNFESVLKEHKIDRIKYLKEMLSISEKDIVNERIARLCDQTNNLKKEYEIAKKQNQKLQRQIANFSNAGKSILSKETPEMKLLNSAFEEILKLNPNDITTGNILLGGEPSKEIQDILSSNNINYVIRIKDFVKNNKKWPNLYIVVRKAGYGKDKNDFKVNIYGQSTQESISESDIVSKSKIHDISIKDYQKISGKYQKSIKDPRLFKELYK